MRTSLNYHPAAPNHLVSALSLMTIDYTNNADGEIQSGTVSTVSTYGVANITAFLDLLETEIEECRAAIADEAWRAGTDDCPDCDGAGGFSEPIGPVCYGEGPGDTEEWDCDRCKGTGQVPVEDLGPRELELAEGRR